jgi:uncharacterized membrane protein
MTEAETERAQPDAIEFAATERLVFFSDAVTAIALTLLAIELPTPEGETSVEVLRSVGGDWPVYASFLVSFFVIAAHWRAHHEVFRYVGASSSRLVQLNIWWLFLTVVTPFTTKMLYDGSTNLARFSAYAIAQTLQFGIFAVMVQVIRRRRLLRDAADLPRLVVPYRRSIIFVVTFGASVPIYALVGPPAFVLWFGVPFGALIVRRVHERSARRRP